MSAEVFARKWYDQFFRTDPIDHQRAEAAVREVYRLAGMAEPQRFLWCASPLEAAWATLVLVGKTESYNHFVYETVEGSKSGKKKLPEIRAWVGERLGIPQDQVEGHFSKLFYRAEGTNPVTKRLHENSDARMARTGKDFLAPHKGGPFKPLHDLEHALYYEGEYRGVGSVFMEALATSNKHVAMLGCRSAQNRLYGNFSYINVAIDEALADAGKFEPTELQRALWDAYAACGMWWPCEAGIVFAERPVVVEGNDQRAAMLWSDGFTVGGKPSVKAAAPSSAAATPILKAKASVLDAKPPTEQSARIAWLRGQSSALPYLDRYLAGDHKQVWKELLALGEKVRTEAHAADALAVAYETMHRVERNVRLIAERLRQMDYRFVQPGSGGGFLGFGKPKPHEPHVPPRQDAHDRLTELEAAVGGPMPLSLRACFELVGEVNFNGDHPSLAPKNSDFTSDPLMVLGVEDALACIESWDDEDDEDDEENKRIDLAPDALHKANISGGDPYSVVVPADTADVLFEDEPHDVPFVEYLRIAILGWGGFPGWEDAKGPIPPELDELRKGLVPF